MKLAGCLLACLLALSAPNSLARQVSEGVYGQTWVSHVDGQCGGCELRVRKVTPHIIELTASNGWSGFAYYVPRQKSCSPGLCERAMLVMGAGCRL